MGITRGCWLAGTSCNAVRSSRIIHKHVFTVLPSYLTGGADVSAQDGRDMLQMMGQHDQDETDQFAAAWRARQSHVGTIFYRDDEAGATRTT